MPIECTMFKALQGLRSIPPLNYHLRKVDDHHHQPAPLGDLQKTIQKGDIHRTRRGWSSDFFEASNNQKPGPTFDGLVVPEAKLTKFWWNSGSRFLGG